MNKLTQPLFFKYMPLQNLLKNPPGKKMFCWGRIVEDDVENGILIIEDNTGRLSLEKERVTELDVLKDLKTGNIIKLFGEITSKGIKINKIIHWNVEWEKLIDYYSIKTK